MSTINEADAISNLDQLVLLLATWERQWVVVTRLNWHASKLMN